MVSRSAPDAAQAEISDALLENLLVGCRHEFFVSFDAGLEQFNAGFFFVALKLQTRAASSNSRNTFSIYKASFDPDGIAFAFPPPSILGIGTRRSHHGSWKTFRERTTLMTLTQKTCSCISLAR